VVIIPFLRKSGIILVNQYLLQSAKKRPKPRVKHVAKLANSVFGTVNQLQNSGAKMAGQINRYIHPQESQ